MVVSLDGGRVRVRRKKRGPKTKKGRNRFHTDWKEPKLLILYVVGDDGRPSQTWAPIIDGTLRGPEAVFALLLSYARQIGLNAADKVLFIADGAPWIWQRIQRLIAALGLSPTQVLGLIDFYHAAKQLSDAVKLRRWSATQRTRWLNRTRALLKRARDRAQAGAAHHAADRRQRARKEIAARQRVAHADRALARRGQPGAAHRVRRVRAAGRRAGAKSKPSSKTTTEPPTRARRDGAGAKHVDESGIGLRQVAAVARRLTPETDFTTDEHRRNVFLTDRGVDRVEHVFDRGSLYDPENLHLLIALQTPCMPSASSTATSTTGCYTNVFSEGDRWISFVVEPRS